ncbi:hypothetical protein [Paraburkholderia flagellata]|uniref:hypothetical protein n=1 Tax=Paraburkholderia flagellata TaxID=2883241 RepID=UPI001F172C8D|nr:hypothetical protein [Paraburkholderia flagellata]
MSEGLIALVGDVFGLANLPGGNVAGFGLKQLMAKRLDAAREVLLNELARGQSRVSEVDLEEGLAIVYRFLRAAQEGAARVNLRLLSQVIANQAWGGTMKADDFLYYADILGPLRRDEMLLLGSLHRNWFDERRLSLDVGQRRIETIGAMKADLVPGVFESDADFFAIADSLTRTGLVATVAAYGGSFYEPSPLLQRVVRMVDFEAAAA